MMCGVGRNGSLGKTKRLLIDFRGSGRIIKTGSGRLGVASNASFTGGTEIREGLLESWGNYAFGTGEIEFVATSSNKPKITSDTWGGPIPPAKPGADREMLKDSVCYWIEGWDKTCLRDCYADTGKVGFRVCSQTQLLGCWYYNNKSFKLDDVTIIEHRGGRLLVTDGWFYKDTPHVTMYKSTNPEARAEWSNMTYVGFGEEKLPGQLKYETDAKWDADQPVDRADDWEFLQQGPYVLQAKPGAYAGGNKTSTESRYVSTRFLTKRFPDCGPGSELVVRARAMTPDTKRVELAITEKDGKVWGAELELTQDWREIRLPFSQLKYFGHWGEVPAFKPGWKPDCRQFTSVRFCYGTWLCPKTTDKAHGLEVSSIKVGQ